eukprot:TRINITY_DN8641_c0_g1_i1.p1 TRINITY_DN8641_c0_g1~~TRINITY_DN8641_c0_g1_i1.p1  ORF type:complete len:572 (-),score=88.69 TRINITY_DN8641_c0_g1_i1:47-1762(-)
MLASRLVSRRRLPVSILYPGKRNVHGNYYRPMRYNTPSLLTVAIGCASYLLYSFTKEDECEAEERREEPPYIKAIRMAATGNLEGLKNITYSMRKDTKEQFLNKKHPGGWTALHAAVCNHHEDVVIWLIENGANVNVADLYQPINFGIKQVRERDFSNSINSNLDCRGWTPLHYAIGFESPSILRILLDAGANLETPNARGHKPRAYVDESTSEGRLLLHVIDVWNQEKAQREKQERVKSPLETKLQSVMVSQVAPIFSVSATIRRRQNGWHDENKPIVMLFLGSSGVGKTMLAKCLAEHIVDDHENGFIRIDMSEYGHKHEVSKFIGAPPGYVGYNEGGQLTEKLKKCPNAVVLLDEVEKAHPDVLTIMLQVFDEGRLTDGRGNTIDCKNAIFIMTSNLVQDEIRLSSSSLRPSCEATRKPSGELDEKFVADLSRVQSETNNFLRRVVQPILKKYFRRDEFLGRINEMVVFHPFNEEDLHKIVEKELDKWSVRALKRHGITLKWDEPLIESLTLDYNESYGFRSIKNEVEKRVINVLAASYERDSLGEGDSVIVGLAEDGSVVVRKEKSE